jgi:hypothetical protein
MDDQAMVDLISDIYRRILLGKSLVIRPAIAIIPDLVLTGICPPYPPSMLTCLCLIAFSRKAKVRPLQLRLN